MGDEAGLESTIIRVPRPAWQFLGSALLAVALVAIGAAMCHAALIARPGILGVVPVRGWVRSRMFVLGAILLVLPLLLPLRLAMSPALVVRDQGLELPKARRWGAFAWFGVVDFFLLEWLFDMIGWATQSDSWLHRIVTWDRIEGCHWGRYDPGTLTILRPEGMATVRVPDRLRAEVEATIRRNGRWREG